MRILIPLVSLFGLAAGAAYAALPNPLMAPKPAAAAQNPQGGPVPDSMRTQGGAPMPSGSPSASMPMGRMEKEKPEIDINAVPDDLYLLEDKFFVAAQMDGMAVLRPRDGVSSGAGAAPAASPNPMQSMGYGQPAMGSPGGSLAGGAAQSSGSSSIARSIILSHGVPIIFKGRSLVPSVKNGSVTLEFETMGGKKVIVYRAGVDVFNVQKTSQATKETPDAAFAEAQNPKQTNGAASAATGATGGTPNSTNGGVR